MVLSEAEAEARLNALRRQREALDRAITDLTLYLELGRRLKAGLGTTAEDEPTEIRHPAQATPPSPPIAPSSASAKSGRDDIASRSAWADRPDPLAPAEGSEPRRGSPSRPDGAVPASPAEGASRPAGAGGQERHDLRAADSGDPGTATAGPWPVPGFATRGADRPPPRPAERAWPEPWPAATPATATGQGASKEARSEAVAARRYGRVLIGAALAVLQEADRPLHASEIWAALAARGFSLPGADPIAALNTRLWKRSGPGGPLRRLGDAVYALPGSRGAPEEVG
ncbi:hypothetical protein MMB17_19650 [Methylobacterium organophilum]|uniref:winged helix-turn-helix domain-containing protein n=1 Tax=Methylobacterium organophilum TaxID=410 RepID=UPI001F12EFB6|nr:winged helix-turn-helix domain-containing protein [Methylobacterium organophilum]UMY16846.1 hypothetical protein MMB17_19650 [Methylobacterium organophilum]